LFVQEFQEPLGLAFLQAWEWSWSPSIVNSSVLCHHIGFTCTNIFKNGSINKNVLKLG
jgi:hypothetical protein